MKTFLKIGRANYVLAGVLLLVFSSCGNLERFSEAADDKYHKLSYNPPQGVDLTIKRHATDAMVAFFKGCENNKSANGCAKDLLNISSSKIEGAMTGRARELWNGQYSIFGYHPNFGKGFYANEAGDLVTAISDLKKRGHKCLCVTWTPGGTNWTTRAAGGNCTYGSKLK